MKRNLLKTVIILLAVTFVTLQSCEKKELVDIEEDVINKNEIPMLKFADISEFSTALETANLSIIPTDFVSMYDVYIQIEETDDDTERNMLIEKHKNILKIDEDDIVELIIVDDVFASFLSPEGLVKVGNEISLVKEDKIVTLTDGDVSKIDLLFQFEEDSPENNIRIDDSVQVVNTDKAYWSGEEEWWVSTTKYKMKWEKWASYSFFNSSVGGKIRSYKKTWRWITHPTSLSLHVRWDRIDWWNGTSLKRSENQHIYDSKSGWSLSERRYVGGAWTPNPVYGLTIDGSVGGHNYSK